MVGMPLVPVDHIRRVVAEFATSKACKARLLQHRQGDGASQDGYIPPYTGLAIMGHGVGLATARTPGTGNAVGSTHRS
jgi:hypothetical protein